MILYFTYWFPAEYRGRVISTLFIAQPVANAIASIASAAILEMDGVLGLKGWQWIFIIEAMPAILLGLVILRAMTDRPAHADWLAPKERDWLQARIDNENRQVESAGRMTWMRALGDPRVVALSMIYLMSVTANYGIVFFMPQIIKGIGPFQHDDGLRFLGALHHRHHRPDRMGLVVRPSTRNAAGI